MPPGASHSGTLVTMGVAPLLVLKTAVDSCYIHEEAEAQTAPGGHTARKQQMGTESLSA